MLGQLKAKEQATGAKILIAIGRRQEGRGVKYRVTIKTLKKRCPEWFDREPNELLPAFNQLARQLKNQIDGQIDAKLSAYVQECEIKIDFLSEKISSLQKDLVKLARIVNNSEK